jgi:hypothetical protein
MNTMGMIAVILTVNPKAVEIAAELDRLHTRH